MANDSVKETKDDTEDTKSKSLWWCLAIILLILGVLVWLGVNEYQKFHTEKTRLGDELVNAKNALSSYQETKVSHCNTEPKVFIKKPHKVHLYTVPKPPIVKQKVFDPKDCGYGTEAGFNKATGKPECRVVPTHVTTFVPAPIPAPVVTKVETPKTEMKCEKPLIRKLNDNNSIECIALPVEAVQPAAANGCLPPDAQGRIFCRVQRTAVSQSVAPVYGGYGYDRYQGYQRPAPRYEQRQYNPSSYWIVPPQQRPDSGPGVSTLPPGPGVTTLTPSHWIVPPQQRPSQGPGITTLPPGPGVTTLPSGPGVVTQ